MGAVGSSGVIITEVGAYSALAEVIRFMAMGAGTTRRSEGAPAEQKQVVSSAIEYEEFLDKPAHGLLPRTGGPTKIKQLLPRARLQAARETQPMDRAPTPAPARRKAEKRMEEDASAETRLGGWVIQTESNSLV